MLRNVVLVTICKNKYDNLPAYAVLLAEFLGTGGSILRDALMQFPEVVDVVGERPRRGNLLFIRGCLLETDARLSAQLFPHAQSDDGHAFAHPLGRKLRKVPSCVDAVCLEHFRIATAYAPDILDREFAEYLFNVLRAVHEATAI